MGFESIKKIIPQVVQSRGISKPIATRQVLQEAPVVLRALWGEEKALLVRTVSFMNGVLRLETRSGPAKQQLVLDGPRFLNELNRRLGERKIFSIDVRSSP